MSPSRTVNSKRGERGTKAKLRLHIAATASIISVKQPVAVVLMVVYYCGIACCCGQWCLVVATAIAVMAVENCAVGRVCGRDCLLSISPTARPMSKFMRTMFMRTRNARKSGYMGPTGNGQSGSRHGAVVPQNVWLATAAILVGSRGREVRYKVVCQHQGCGMKTQKTDKNTRPMAAASDYPLVSQPPMNIRSKSYSPVIMTNVFTTV